MGTVGAASESEKNQADALRGADMRNAAEGLPCTHPHPPPPTWSSVNHSCNWVINAKWTEPVHFTNPVRPAVFFPHTAVGPAQACCHQAFLLSPYLPTQSLCAPQPALQAPWWTSQISPPRPQPRRKKNKLPNMKASSSSSKKNKKQLKNFSYCSHPLKKFDLIDFDKNSIVAK